MLKERTCPYLLMEELTTIQSKIYEIRGQRVMLDFDLAALYQVTTSALNQAVKRNIERFPEEFTFRISEIEWKNMSSQIVMTYFSTQFRKCGT